MIESCNLLENDCHNVIIFDQQIKNIGVFGPKNSKFKFSFHPSCRELNSTNNGLVTFIEF